MAAILRGGFLGVMSIMAWASQIHPPSPLLKQSQVVPPTVLGTVDLLLVETTPLVIQGALYRFESVRPEYWDNKLSMNASGPSYLRFVNVATGEQTAMFGPGRGLGCAVYDDTSRTVYAFGTAEGGTVVDVFWSSDGMKSWQNQTAIDFGRLKKKVWNTSVGRGRLNGTDVWAMGFELSVAGTPGAWNTAFATATELLGGWTLDQAMQMPIEEEHANPTLRWMNDGYWYCITARQRPGSWYFFSEIYRSQDLTEWESGRGMGTVAGTGVPLLGPNHSLDTQVAPSVASDQQPADGSSESGGWLTREMAGFLTKLRYFFVHAEDVNASDLDLCEWRNQTVMYFNWGEQHSDNGIALAVADLPLKSFLQQFFD